MFDSTVIIEAVMLQSSLTLGDYNKTLLRFVSIASVTCDRFVSDSCRAQAVSPLLRKTLFYLKTLE